MNEEIKDFGLRSLIFTYVVVVVVNSVRGWPQLLLTLLLWVYANRGGLLLLVVGMCACVCVWCACCSCVLCWRLFRRRLPQLVMK